MTSDDDHVLNLGVRLVKQSRRTQHLLQQVLDCCGDALYDPVSDRYAVRFPGGLVRTIRDLLAEAERDPNLPNPRS